MSLSMKKYTKTLFHVEAQVVSHCLDYLIFVSSSASVSMVIFIFYRLHWTSTHFWSCLTSPTIHSQEIRIPVLNIMYHVLRKRNFPASCFKSSQLVAYVHFPSTCPLHNSPSPCLFFSVSLFPSPIESFLLEPCGIAESLTHGGTWIIPALLISL